MSHFTLRFYLINQETGHLKHVHLTLLYLSIKVENINQHFVDRKKNSQTLAGGPFKSPYTD